MVNISLPFLIEDACRTISAMSFLLLTFLNYLEDRSCKILFAKEYGLAVSDIKDLILEKYPGVPIYNSKI